MKTDKFNIAAETRQLILNYAWKVGEVSARMVADYMEINVDHALRSMSKMAAAKEMERCGWGLNLTFKPRKRQTTSAQEMRDNALHKRYEPKTQPTDPDSRISHPEPGRMVHIVAAHHKVIPFPHAMSTACQQNGELGEARLNGWDCHGCRHYDAAI